MLSLDEIINNTINNRIAKYGTKSKQRKVTPRETNSKNNPNRSRNRPNPMITKAGVTKSGRRTFGNGGEIK